MNVAEIQIQCDQYAIFSSGAIRYHCIVRSRQPLIDYCIGIEAGVSEKNRTLSGQVLVDLEFQTVCSKGRSAVPSRASSAAYARAA